MLQTGRYHNFLVVRRTGKGWLIEAEGEQLEVPKKELISRIQPGHRVKLFVYNKGNNEIRATSTPPLGVLYEFCFLKVKEATPFGFFLDWGIPKDLFVPKRFTQKEIEPGQHIIVKIIPDGENGQVLGTCMIDEELLEKPGDGLKVNQQASIMICGIKDIGMKVIINNRYRGMLYKEEVTDEIRYGQKLKGYIKKIRPDGKIDVTLIKPQKGMRR